MSWLTRVRQGPQLRSAAAQGRSTSGDIFHNRDKSSAVAAVLITMQPSNEAPLLTIQLVPRAHDYSAELIRDEVENWGLGCARSFLDPRAQSIFANRGIETSPMTWTMLSDELRPSTRERALLRGGKVMELLLESDLLSTDPAIRHEIVGAINKRIAPARHSPSPALQR